MDSMKVQCPSAPAVCVETFAQALVLQTLKLEKPWNQDAFFDNVDRFIAISQEARSIRYTPASS